MQAKCPYCQDGCDQCVLGFIEVSLPEPDAKCWTIECLNQADCGFLNGACFDERFIKEKEQCVNCHGPARWVEVDKARSSGAYLKPENDAKWRIKILKEHNDALRELLKQTREVGIEYLINYADLLEEQMNPIPIEHARLLRVCRICLQPDTAPFTYNYGQEYAHTKCLPFLKD